MSEKDQAAKADAAEQNEWKNAAIELCMITEAVTPTDDPKATIIALIDYYVGVHDDAHARLREIAVEQNRAQVGRAVQLAVAHCSRMNEAEREITLDEEIVADILRELAEQPAPEMDWRKHGYAYDPMLPESGIASSNTDSWIEWTKTAAIPVVPGTTVKVKFRNGHEMECVPSWVNTGRDDSDIVGYRIVQPPSVARQELTDDVVQRAVDAYNKVFDPENPGHWTERKAMKAALLSTQQPQASAQSDKEPM